jgi:hypothetical protein
MGDALAWLGEHVLVPALSGTAGVVGGYLLAALKFGERIGKLETRVADDEKALEAHKTDSEGRHDELKQEFQRRVDRETHTDLAAAAEEAKLLQEDRERWEQVHRTLGRIEGFIALSDPAPNKGLRQK